MTETLNRPAWRRWALAGLPLFVFASLAALFWYALQAGDPSRLPSAMVGKPVPSFTLPPIEGLTGPGAAGFGAALIGFIVADDRRQRFILAELERRGVTRRSAKPKTGKAAAKPKTGKQQAKAKTMKSAAAKKSKS